MGQWVRTLAAKPDDLGSILRNWMMKREDWPTNCFLTSNVPGMFMPTHRQTHKFNLLYIFTIHTIYICIHCVCVFVCVHTHIYGLSWCSAGWSTQHASQSSLRSRCTGLAWVQGWTVLQIRSTDSQKKQQTLNQVTREVIPSFIVLHHLQVSYNTCCKLQTKEELGEHFEWWAWALKRVGDTATFKTASEFFL